MPARFRNWTKQILKGQPGEAAGNSTYPYDIPREWVDDIIPVDDASRDGTVDLARRLGLRVFVHEKNRGYGGNQKTCYTEAMKLGADIMSMVHPDHQHDPRVIPGLVTPLLSRECDAVFGSRMLGGRPIEGGMPWWKYRANVYLTAFENATFYMYLTEYHSRLRAYSRRYLESVNFMANSNDFAFDSEIITQGVIHGMRILEIAIETRYFKEASMAGLCRSSVYGLSCHAKLVEAWGEWMRASISWRASPSDFSALGRH